jgi:hypothetical protein
MADRHVAARLSDEIIDRVDAIAERLTNEWHRATRSDALRAVIARGLTAIESDASLPVTVVHSESAVREMPPTAAARRQTSEGAESDTGVDIMKIYATLRFVGGPAFGVGVEFSDDSPPHAKIGLYMGEIRSAMSASPREGIPAGCQSAKFTICEIGADPVDLGETVMVDPRQFTSGMYCESIGAAIDRFAARFTTETETETGES